MQQQNRTVEQKLAQLAHGAHGLVTRRRLTDASISDEEIRQRLDRGTLIREYPGVYRVGHRAPSTEARYLAAVLACGAGALLSGKAAAHLLGVLKGPPPPPEVTTRTERRIKGVRTRRSPAICDQNATKWKGIPVTSVPRTLVDLAATLSLDDLARACHEARVNHGTTPAHVDAVLARRPNATGAAKLRAVLHGDARVLLSKLEKRFVKLLEDAGLPLPITNRPAGGRYVDCRWPEHRLTVELDSYTYHASRHAWERDRRREREARARGDDFRRFTYGDVFDTPHVVLAELRPVLVGAG